MTDGKLTDNEIDAIRDHAMRLVKGWQKCLNNFRAIPLADRTAHVNGQILYWDHAISAVKLYVYTAEQRRLKVPNG